MLLASSSMFYIHVYDVNASVILPRNVYAVQTVLHHIPGLAPRFLYANPGAISWKHHITLLLVAACFQRLKPSTSRFSTLRGPEFVQSYDPA